MSRSVYITSSEGSAGKSMVALGLVDLLSRRVGRVGVFRPVSAAPESADADSAPDARDTVLEMLLAHPAVDQPYDDALGVTYQQWHADESAALAEIVERFHRVAARYDFVVVQGSDWTDIATGSELAANARVAVNLGAPVVLVVPGVDRTPRQTKVAVELAQQELASAQVHPTAVIAMRVRPEDSEPVRRVLADGPVPLAGVVPEVPLLVAPTVEQLREACGGTLVRGDEQGLERESLGFVVAAMSLPNVLTRLHDDVTVIAPGDRSDLLPGLVMAHQSGTFPRLSAVVLTGGYRPPEPVAQLLDGVPVDLPFIVSDQGTFETASALSGVRGRMTATSRAKIETALRVFAETVDGTGLLDALDVAQPEITTPVMFQHQLLERARGDRRHVVLPEGEDERILRAAATLSRLGVADLTLLGDPAAVLGRAAGLGLDLGGVRILSPHDEALVDRFAAEYVRLRAHKGVTPGRARDVVQDVSYFGTMMVHLGLADAMVSGAAHTTAHTIRPAFEIIRTTPGTTIVSSVFLMCLADRVLAYGDCAVNPDPDAGQLAEIAISSADTAAQFGIDPRIAMLSYSTGTSGAGADVDKVRQATELVRARRPDLLVEGPIQYDAAVDPTVAAAKLPDSPVAGRATVLIFPDLNTGNNTYKAVQRSAGALAIGPVLQGLNRPVNDLSRGALVADIVNTVAITAVQAQAGPRSTPDAMQAVPAGAEDR
ncbi:phosphate acetyltransferase [Nakamurella leprariae]|uniref:Phosphate acetyltransferase n=1 Tax=Nakamurella leprariae TaxID=2803911 RepID=A0A939BZD8_9ACTN|nr:phosphate acetyltransferase [Nakamurella leprariae]MBM9468040.1 phosphate acetyltransferase [Nakamurella leprariae]